MTNRIAVPLALLIAGAIAADLMLNGGRASLYLARKLLTFVEYIAFWR
jgi:hypothetical protein